MKNKPLLALGESELGVLASIIEVLKLRKWPKDMPLPEPLLPTLFVRSEPPAGTPQAYGLNYWEAVFLRGITREPQTAGAPLVTQRTISVWATTWQGSSKDDARPDSLMQIAVSEVSQTGNGPTESHGPVWSWKWAESLDAQVSPLASLLRAEPSGELVVCKQRNWSHLFPTEPYLVRRLLPNSPVPDQIIHRIQFTNADSYLDGWKLLIRLATVASGLARAPMELDAAFEKALTIAAIN